MATLLNTMANYNEKTIGRIMMSVFKKFSVGQTDALSKLHFAEWNLNNNYIAAGGAQGNMRVVKIGSDGSPDPNKLPGTLLVNQPLEGHNATVLSATWNENHQKLTTADTSGLIIVWGIFNDQWFEEMINNRNKSVVVGICWNNEGTKIAIAYADGSVIVGTIEGNRIWNKDLDCTLSTCEWAPDGEMLIFATTDGKIIVVDGMGDHHTDINLVCLETVELEQALAKEPQKEEIVCLKYWSPTLKTKVVVEDVEKKREKEQEKEKEKEITGTAVFINQPKPAPKENLEPERPSEPIQPIPPERPRFLIAFSRGIIQIMRSFQDPDPVIVRLPTFKLFTARWSPNGAFVAVCGQDFSHNENGSSAVYFISAYGDIVGYFRANEFDKMTAISWEGTGLRVTCCADGNLLIAAIKPDYKWGSFEGVVVYVYQKEELNQYGVMFYDYKADERISSVVTNFENIAFYREHCLIVSCQMDEASGNVQYFCQLCNSIGTSLDYNTTSVFPQFCAVNGMAAVIASADRYFIWHFVLPKFNSVQAGIHVPGKSGEYILEEQQRVIEYGTKRLLSGTRDEICALCIGDTFFLIALVAGGLYRVSLADGVILASYPSAPTIDAMKMNCNSTRVAISILQDKCPFELSMFLFEGPDAKTMTETKTFKRKEIWGFEWDLNDESTLVYKEKHKLMIWDGTTNNEQTNVNGAIISFENLVVNIVNLDKLLTYPENPPKGAIQEVPIKAKLDVSNLLNNGKTQEAIEYAEKTSHEELWKIIAKSTTLKRELDNAEHAYVRLGDYPGVQFIKKLRNIPLEKLQNAEICFMEDKLDMAKKWFLDSDRKDLLVEMYQKLCDYNSVFEIVKNDEDEVAKADAHRHLADYHYEQLDWEDAARDYEACGDVGMQIDCLIRGNAFGDLEVLSRTLPSDNEHMETMGDAFTLRGMCDQAVECYLRKDLPEKALHCCMELNQWQKAHFIAESNHLQNVEGLLGKYAIETKGESNEKSLSALSLYMRAGRNLDAAKLVFDIAKDRQSKFLQYEELKQCYVLGAILVEQNRQSMKELKKIDKNNILDETLDDEAGLTAEQSRIFENTWRGAEAFHYIMLAQGHFFEERIEDALQTSVVLSDYEEYLDPAEIYSMIALAASNVNQFGICSKAMMRLETLEDFEESEKEEMRDLSFRLFSEHPPVNPNAAKVNCPSCETKIDPYDLQCNECYTKFPVCIASGRLIFDNVFWLCSRCKHRAHRHEIMKWNYCPLCHDVESFKK